MMYVAMNEGRISNPVVLEIDPEIIFDESITAEEQRSIRAMQEDLNYLIDSLNK